MARPGVIALFGPTAVGKTAIAIALARSLREQGAHPVAVSADALQVYRGLELLTSVATAAQQAELEHRLVSFLPVTERFSAGRYARLAHAEIDSLLAEGALPLVVGGTGLYLRAALADLDLLPPVPAALRARVRSEIQRRGSHAVHADLASRAPWAASAIDPGDGQRVARAVELLELGELAPRSGPSELWTGRTRHPTELIALVMDRPALYERIDRRVEAMVAAGAVEQVRAADRAGASETARRALGFGELLAGDLEGMKRRTRNYAKRQLTWLRKLPGAEVVDVTGRAPDELARALLARAHARD